MAEADSPLLEEIDEDFHIKYSSIRGRMRNYRSQIELSNPNNTFLIDSVMECGALQNPVV